MSRPGLSRAPRTPPTAEAQMTKRFLASRRTKNVSKDYLARRDTHKTETRSRRGGRFRDFFLVRDLFFLEKDAIELLFTERIIDVQVVHGV